MLEKFEGRTAVVTGGGSGLGQAMGQRFAQEGMHVVLADVRPDALDTTVAEMRAEGLDVLGVTTDVADLASVEALRDAAIDAFGAVHVVCNNAGIGAGAEGRVWEHQVNDWRWAIGVNLWGVIHGINAFVPHMLDHGDEGHIVNTSSGNGGISPLSTTPEYSVTKAAVVTLTEVLYAQLEEVQADREGPRISASVLFPGPHMLRTGLFDAWKHRPAELANPTPRRAPGVTLDQYEQMMADAGVEVRYTPVEEVAGRVVDAIHADDFWILPPNERSDESVRLRAASMLDRSNPTYMRAVAG